MVKEFINYQFSKLIKSGGRLREFNFRRHRGVSGLEFRVDVSDEKGERYYLDFDEVDSHWRWDEESMPVWITESIPKLEETIRHSLGA
jgi:hypothetical protein